MQQVAVQQGQGQQRHHPQLASSGGILLLHTATALVMTSLVRMTWQHPELGPPRLHRLEQAMQQQVQQEVEAEAHACRLAPNALRASVELSTQHALAQQQQQQQQQHLQVPVCLKEPHKEARPAVALLT
jgi:hypothetical protein